MAIIALVGVGLTVGLAYFFYSNSQRSGASSSSTNVSFNVNHISSQAGRDINILLFTDTSQDAHVSIGTGQISFPQELVTFKSLVGGGCGGIINGNLQLGELNNTVQAKVLGGNTLLFTRHKIASDNELPQGRVCVGTLTFTVKPDVQGKGTIALTNRPKWLILGPQGQLEVNFDTNYNSVQVEIQNDTSLTGTPVPQPSTSTPTPSSSTSVTPIPPSVTPTIPADHYRVFVTSQTYDGNLGGLEGADEKCQTLANNAGLGTPNTSFKAWLSDNTHDAIDRIGVNVSKPYTLVDGTLVASDIQDLVTDNGDENYLHNTINIDENGTTITDIGYAFTGSSENGTLYGPNRTCDDWLSNNNENMGRAGLAPKTKASWTSFFSQKCYITQHLYCFETDTPVSTPTPTSINPSPTETPTPGDECPRKSEGDANCDGQITLLDFDRWRQEYLGELNTTTADFNASSDVTLIDYEIWRSHRE